MKRLLRSFKKSEVAIYAIAIMLVAAGYLNYTTMSKDLAIEASSEEYANIGDAKLVNSDDILENNVQEDKSESNQEEVIENKVEENITSEEVVETNSNESDYFVSSKLDRDTNYASMISSYTAILEKDNVTETEKKVAMQEINNINNTKNAIMICENLLSTKGFQNCVIFINDKSINVVVKSEGGLDKEKVAQIHNIVSRELKAEISNIHITEK